MKRTIFSWLLLVCTLAPVLSQKTAPKRLYVEHSASVRGGYYTMFGLGLTAGWHLSPHIAIGMGVEYLAYHERGLIFTGQIRGYAPTPGWNRLYYSFKAGIGPLLFREVPHVPDDGGRIFMGEVEIGFRASPWFTLATGYAGWKHRRIHRSWYIGTVSESTTFQEQHTLTARGIFTLDPYGPQARDHGNIYGYAILGLLGSGVLSYTNFPSATVVDQAGYAGVGYNLNRHWGVGMGFSGLAGVGYFGYNNRRRVQGLGVQGLFTHNSLVVMAETGYAIRVEDDYFGGYHAYSFSPNAQRNVGHTAYYRASVGTRLGRNFLLIANVLGTYPAWGQEQYSFTNPDDGLYNLQESIVRKALFSWQVGIGYLVGRTRN